MKLLTYRENYGILGKGPNTLIFKLKLHNNAILECIIYSQLNINNIWLIGTKYKHHDVPTTQCVAVQTDMEPTVTECVSEQKPAFVFVCCVSYRDRLSPCGLVVNLSWAQRRCLGGCRGLWWLVQLHAKKPHQHGEGNRKQYNEIQRRREEKSLKQCIKIGLC